VPDSAIWGHMGPREASRAAIAPWRSSHGREPDLDGWNPASGRATGPGSSEGHDRAHRAIRRTTIVLPPPRFTPAWTDGTLTNRVGPPSG